MDVSTRDLVCLHLSNYGWVPESESVPEKVTVLGIADALEMGTNVAARTELLADFRGLREEGLVREAVRPVETTGERRRAYFLTDEGRRRAEEVRDRVRDLTVEVTNGVTERVRVDELDRYFEDAPVVRGLARLTDGGTIRLDRYEYAGFVGRGEQLRALEDAVADLHATGGHAVVVTGEAGAGKTALVEEFRTRLRDRDPEPAVGVGTCGAERGAPYGPFRAAFADLPDADLEAVLDGAAALSGDDPETVRGQRRSLFADVADAVREVVDRRPVVLVIEDLQWADPATVDLLEFLVEELAQWIYPVLFVVTARPAALDGDSRTGEFLAALEDERHRRVDLPPLDAAGVRGIIQHTLETEAVPESFVEAVREHTGGNPLFVTESARHLAESGVVDPGRGEFPTTPEGLGVSGTVDRVVEERLSALDGTGREVLALGAVVGESFPRAVLAAASDLPAVDLREYVDLLVEAGIWERDGDRLGFVHGVVRETALDRLDPVTHREYHRRAARALEAVYGDDVDEHYADIARHYRAAGETDEAITNYRRAGDRAVEVYAHEAAVEYYRAALELARETEAATGRWAVDLAAGLAAVYLRTGEYAAAADTVETAREWASTDPERRRLARIAATAAQRRGDNAAAIETAIEHLPPEGTDPSREVCRLLHVKAEAEIERGEFDAAETTAERMLDAAGALEADSLVADAHALLGEIDQRLHNHEGTRAHYEAALEARESDDPHAAARDHEALGRLAMNRAESDRAREEFAAALETFEDLGDRHRVAETHQMLGAANFDGEAYDRAREHWETALEAFEEMGERGRAAGVRMSLGSVLGKRDEHDRAREVFETALSDLQSVGDSYAAAIARLNLAHALLNLGELGAAREHGEKALATFRDYDDRHHVGQVLHNLGEVAIEREDHEGARDRLEESVNTFASNDEYHSAVRALAPLVELADEHAPDLVGEYCERARELVAAVEAAGGSVQEAGVADALARIEAVCDDTIHDGE